ncbi:MAG: hypothetical protein JST59_30605 [Actinobacteria bacterium]|nr:hypothetical protein [Actinomycetota bacterium]
MGYMPLPASLTKFSSQLPYGLRVDLEGYVNSVAAAQSEIYAESRVGLDAIPTDEFLFVAAVWHLWTHVDSQRWIVSNSLRLADEFGAGSIQAGAVRLSSGSGDVEGLRRLHNDFRRWLYRNDLEFVIGAQNVGALLSRLTERDGDGG